MLSMPSIYFPFPPESTAIPPAKQIPAIVAKVYVTRFNIADSSFGSEKYKSVDKVHDGALNVEVQPDRGLITIDEVTNVLTAVIQAKVDEVVTGIVVLLVDPTDDQTGIGGLAANAVQNFIQSQEPICTQAVIGHLLLRLQEHEIVFGLMLPIGIALVEQDRIRRARRVAYLDNLVDLLFVAHIIGDGTLNEVITGLMQAETRPVLGYVPAGTTNDFAFSLGISKVPAEAAVIAAGDTLQALDIGRFNDRYFNYIAAFGAFTEVSYETPQQTKNIFGRAAYIIEGIKALTNIKTYHIRVNSAETQMEDDFIYGMVTNTVSVGGFKTIRPDGVALDDGLYEVLLIYPVENPMELQWLANDLLTHNIESNRFAYFRTSKISFSSDDEVTWTLDGEFGGALHNVQITNCSRAITFATGKEPECKES